MAGPRYISTYQNATATGSASNPGITGYDITTPDDAYDRHITGIFVSPQTAGLAIRVVIAGQQVCQIDTSAFSAANGPLPIQADALVGQQFHIDFANMTGGAVNNNAITIQYNADR